MILCHYMSEHALQVAGCTVIYRYSITESLYLFTLDGVRVPGYIRRKALT